MHADLIARLKRQKLSAEMDDEARDGADWQGGYDGMVESGREAATAILELGAEVERLTVAAAVAARAQELAAGITAKIIAGKINRAEAAEAKLAEIAVALSDLNITDDELQRLRNSMESKEWVQVWTRACQKIIDCVRDCRRIATLKETTHG